MGSSGGSPILGNLDNPRYILIINKWVFYRYKVWLYNHHEDAIIWLIVPAEANVRP